MFQRLVRVTIFKGLAYLQLMVVDFFILICVEEFERFFYLIFLLVGQFSPLFPLCFVGC